MLSRPPASLAAATSARPAARRLVALAQDLRDLVLGDHRRQPVAAEQDDVAVARRGTVRRVDLRRRAPARARG